MSLAQQAAEVDGSSHPAEACPLNGAAQRVAQSACDASAGFPSPSHITPHSQPHEQVWEAFWAACAACPRPCSAAPQAEGDAEEEQKDEGGEVFEVEKVGARWVGVFVWAGGCVRGCVGAWVHGCVGGVVHGCVGGVVHQ